MGFFADPVKSVSDTVSHIGDVIATDPTAQAAVGAAAIAGAAYLSGGLSLGAEAATTATGAEAVTIPAGASTVASVTAAAQAIGSGALATIDTGVKVLGGINAINTLSGNGAKSIPSTPAFKPSGVSVVPSYASPSTGGLQAPPNQAGAVAGAAAAALPAATSKDSTLTVLASGLTIAAILYQFSKGK
jgi:hypothetical protein